MAAEPLVHALSAEMKPPCGCRRLLDRMTDDPRRVTCPACKRILSGEAAAAADAIRNPTAQEILDGVLAALRGEGVPTRCICHEAVERAWNLRMEAWPPARAALRAARQVAGLHAAVVYEQQGEDAWEAMRGLRAAVDEADRLAAEAQARFDARFEAAAGAMHAGKPLPRHLTYDEVKAQRDALLAAAREVLARDDEYAPDGHASLDPLLDAVAACK